MKIERVSPTLLQIRLHALELAPLIAVARWALEGGTGELPADAKHQLEQILKNYDDEMARNSVNGDSSGPPADRRHAQADE